MARQSYRKMTAAQFENVRRKLGLSQVRAAKFAGYTKRSGQRWASGEQAVPESVAMLLWLMVEMGLMPEDIG